MGFKVLYIDHWKSKHVLQSFRTFNKNLFFISSPICTCGVIMDQEDSPLVKQRIPNRIE